MTAFRFGVTIHLPTFTELDRLLNHADASQIIHNLYRYLPQVTAEERTKRDAAEPDVFRYSMHVIAFGVHRELDFAVNDGWEADRLHVVDVRQTLGKRAITPTQLGPLE